MKVLKTGWGEIADGTATGIAKYRNSTFAVKDGYYWGNRVWVRDRKPEENTIIATRPKQPIILLLQKQAIEDYHDRLGDQSGDVPPETYFKAPEKELQS